MRVLQVFYHDCIVGVHLSVDFCYLISLCVDLALLSPDLINTSSQQPVGTRRTWRVGTNGFGHFPSFRVVDVLRKGGEKMDILLLPVKPCLFVVHTDKWRSASLPKDRVTDRSVIYVICPLFYFVSPPTTVDLDESNMWATREASRRRRSCEVCMKKSFFGKRTETLSSHQKGWIGGYSAYSGVS